MSVGFRYIEGRDKWLEEKIGGEHLSSTRCMRLSPSRAVSFARRDAGNFCFGIVGSKAIVSICFSIQAGC